MKYKVLYTTSDASPQSGAFRSLLYMSRGIVECGYEPVLALHQEGQKSPFLSSKEQKQGHFFDLPRLRRGGTAGYYLRYIAQNFQSIHALARLIRDEQISLVHVNEILDLYAGLAARIVGIPCVWHIRADLTTVPRLRRILTRIVLILANRIIVVSQSVQERMFQERGKGKVVVINNPGPSLTQFHPDVDGSTVRKELDLEENAFIVTLVAKLVETKGHETLIHAAPTVLASFPETYFLLVGGELEAAHHKEYASELKSLVQKLGVQDRVIFTGFRSDIAKVMAASTIVTHCSVYPDPFPGVVLQGMATGKPVIASDLGGPREQLEHEISGILVPPNNPKELANQISQLLADEQKRHLLGCTAAEHVRSQFGKEKFFQQLSEVYSELLDGS